MSKSVKSCFPPILYILLVGKDREFQNCSDATYFGTQNQHVWKSLKKVHIFQYYCDLRASEASYEPGKIFFSAEKLNLKKKHEWNIWGKYNWQLDRIHQYIIKSHWVSWIIFCILHQNKCYFPFLSLRKKVGSSDGHTGCTLLSYCVIFK